MATKTLDVRMQQKHATPGEWEQSNLIPLAGEIIVYDDAYLTKQNDKIKVADAIRFKIGDGVTPVNDLPFADAVVSAKVQALEQKVGELTPTGSSSKLTPVDGTIVLENKGNGETSIGIAIAPVATNALVAVEGGLFVPKPVIPEYTIQQVNTTTGFAATYQLMKIIDGEASRVGDPINIAKDLVLKTVTLEVVSENNTPYEGAKVGDPYIKMVFNDAAASNIYLPVKGLVDTYTAGQGIEIINNQISVKLADTTHGLVAVDGGALSINLATKTSDGAMSKEDKCFLDSIPYIYEARKYEVSSMPVGTLVDYRDDEIRIMCPHNTKWSKQNSGEGADKNKYYIGFKAYAPQEAVSFKEDLAEIIANPTMYYFENNSYAGIDEYGRKYSVIWLPVAQFENDTWRYFGAKSGNTFVGWHYTVEWYDQSLVKLSSDTIRINLSNEDCHNNNQPYYMANYATTDEVTALSTTVSNLGKNFVWGEL